MQIESVALNKIIPYIRNPRKNENAVEKVASSIKEFGFRQPIVVDSENVIIAGHTRFEAAKRLGLDVVPIHVADGLTEQQAKAYRIADNRVSQEAEWDYDLLKLELEELDNPELTGFDEDELNGILAEVGEGMTGEEGLTDPDQVPEAPAIPITVPGDLWELGEHRLLCGDATSENDVERLMDGQQAELCFTSPPYNVGGNTMGGHLKDSDNYSKYASTSDKLSDDDYLKLLNLSTANALSCCQYSVFNLQILAQNKKTVLEWMNGFKNHFADVAIWNKEHGAPAMPDNVLNAAFEFLFIFSSETNPTRRIKTANFRGTVNNVYTASRGEKNAFASVHAATFPVHLPMWVISTFTESGDVMDLFCGTGTTLIACEKTGRKSYGLEIDPQYCDVIITRWSEFTGKDDLLLNGKPFKWSERKIKKAA